MLKQKESWYLPLGAVVSFAAAVAFFVLKSPAGFLDQTILWQTGRYHSFPSLVNIVSAFSSSPGFAGMSFLPALLSIPLGLGLLNKGSVQERDFFLASTLILGVVFCQSFDALPRYYMSVYVLLLLGMGGVFSLDGGTAFLTVGMLDSGSKVKLVGVCAMAAVFLGLTTILLGARYTSYDMAVDYPTSTEGYVYQQTVEYLKSVSPSMLWSVNPVYAAMLPDVRTTGDVDTYGLLALRGDTPEKLFKNKVAEGVDYVVVDNWIWDWGPGEMKTTAESLYEEIRSNATLVQTVTTPLPTRKIEIYRIVIIPAAR